jgi:hypothetical protein
MEATMSKKLPPDRDPNLRQSFALPESDQVAKLYEMAGEQSQGLVPTTPPPPPKRTTRRRRPSGDFLHPKEAPDVTDMIWELSRARGPQYDRGFGHFAHWSAWHVAADCETQIYNAWVRLQCIDNNLRSPGSLSIADYVDRFWHGDDDGDAR